MVRRLIFPAFLGLAIYYAVFGGEYSVFDVQRVQGETLEARERLERLRDSTEVLQGWVEALDADPRTLETLARERFGMVYPGEILYRFADGDDEEEEEGV